MSSRRKSGLRNRKSVLRNRKSVLRDRKSVLRWTLRTETRLIVEIIDLENEIRSVIKLLIRFNDYQ